MLPSGGPEEREGRNIYSPPVVPLLRTEDIPAEHQACHVPRCISNGSGDSIYSSAESSSWQQSSSSYGSPRASGECSKSAPAAASNLGAAAGQHSRKDNRQRRRSPERRHISLRTAGLGRCRSSDMHPAFTSALEHALHALHEGKPPSHLSSGIHPGVMPLAPLPHHFHRAEQYANLGGYESGSSSEMDTMSESSVEAEVTELQSGTTKPDQWAAQWEEGVKLLKMAAPLAAQSLFNQGCFYISQAFAGHLGRMELSVAVLATSILNVTGFAALAGLASAMETLCGQAYGAGSYRMVGVVLQRALLVCFCAMVSLLPVWLYVEPLLRAIGQEAELSRLAARYVMLSVPSVFFSGIAECLKRYLMAQGVVMPTALVSFVSTLMAPAVNWSLIHRAGFGLDGAAYANDVTFLITALLLTLYVSWYHFQVQGRLDDTWQGWSWECFSGWGTYLRIALPSSIMVCMEWWVVEVVIILAGLLPEPSLSVSVTGICINVMSLVYMLSFGLSGAASTRVGNALGGGRPRAARRTAYASGVLSLAATLVSAACILTLSHDVAHLFTGDVAVRKATAALAPLLAVVVIGDGLNATFSGVIRGAARQTLGVAVNLAAYWGLGMPLMILLAFPFHWGVRGFWSGMAVMCAVQGCILAVVSLRLDWAAEARRASALVHESPQPLGDAEAPRPQQPLLTPLLPRELDGSS